jgi:hypothetical protein
MLFQLETAVVLKGLQAMVQEMGTAEIFLLAQVPLAPAPAEGAI